MWIFTDATPSAWSLFAAESKPSAASSASRYPTGTKPKSIAPHPRHSSSPNIWAFLGGGSGDSPWRAGRNSSALQPQKTTALTTQKTTRNDETLYLTCPLINLCYARIAPVTLKRELLYVTVAAVNLERFAGDELRHLRRLQLSH